MLIAIVDVAADVGSRGSSDTLSLSAVAQSMKSPSRWGFVLAPPPARHCLFDWRIV